MWCHYLYNKQSKIGFENQTFYKYLVKQDFENNLKYCIEKGDIIKFISKNEFQSYRNNKLCIICKYYNID